MPQTITGILGTGFLGKELIRAFSWHDDSWSTIRRRKTKTQDQLQQILFRWDDPATWDNIPDSSAVLILTIPPVYPEIKKEKKRLETWGEWMRSNRPALRRMVYISSTSVYPMEERVWREDDPFIPDNSKGKLRLETENTLRQFFDLDVVRPGGIYGPKRHLGIRILQNMPVPKSDRPIHRIHVYDLANLVRSLAEGEGGGAVVNAVDHLPAPSVEVARWLMRQPFFEIPEGVEPELTDRDCFSPVRPPDVLTKKRLISNEKLLKDLGLTLRFPTYKEGFEHAVIFTEG